MVQLYYDIGCCASWCAYVWMSPARDTFPFEERAVFAQAVAAVQAGDLDTARRVLARRRGSVWAGRGESQVQWQLVQAAVDLIQACEDRARELPDHARSQDALLDFYLASLHGVDRLQREFEAAAGDFVDAAGDLAPVVRLAQQRLPPPGRPGAGAVRQAPGARRLAAQRPPGQRRPVRPAGRAQAARERPAGGAAAHRRAALRAGAGAAQPPGRRGPGRRCRRPSRSCPRSRRWAWPACCPARASRCGCCAATTSCTPMLGDQTLSNVTQRMDLLRRRYGQRFAEATLQDFLRPAFELPAAVELLVLRSNEMDADFESNPEAAPSLHRPHLPAGARGRAQAARPGLRGRGDRHRPRLLPQHRRRRGRRVQPAARQLAHRPRAAAAGRRAGEPLQRRAERGQTWASAATSTRRPARAP